MALHLPLFLVFCFFCSLESPFLPGSNVGQDQNNLSPDSVVDKTKTGLPVTGVNSTKPFANYESMYPIGLFPSSEDTLEIPDSLKCKIPKKAFQSFSKERQEYYLNHPQLYIISEE